MRHKEFKKSIDVSERNYVSDVDIDSRRETLDVNAVNIN